MLILVVEYLKGCLIEIIALRQKDNIL